MDIEKEVRDVIVEQLRVKPEEVKPETNFKDFSIDSLDTVELVMAFEDAFDIEISDEDARKLLTVKHVIDYIKEKVEDKPKA